MLKRNKYGSLKNKDKPGIDGYLFDSGGELKRYCELKHVTTFTLLV